MAATLESLVTIRHFTYPVEAYLAQAKLESFGIHAFIQDQHLVQLNVWYSQAVGGVKLQVFESDAALANQILDEVKPVEELDDEKDACPKCGNHDIYYDREARKIGRAVFSLISFFLLGLPWLFRSKTYRCRICGHMWM